MHRSADWLSLASRRDLRIDFFRGVALLIVLVDHVEGWSEIFLIESWTLISLGFSDAAEIFVFLSGYVFATAYSRTLDEHGFVACMKKAVWRSLQIYVAYLLAAWSVIAIGALASDWNPPAYSEGFLIGQRPWESVVAALTLSFQPWGIGILPFYILVLPAMAAMLLVHRWNSAVAWMISAGAYFFVQLEPHQGLRRFGDDILWPFNPLAWQLLFFIGMSLSLTAARRTSYGPRWVLVPLSIAVLAWGLFVMKGCTYLERWDVASRETLMPYIYFYWDWGNKVTLQPLRLIHFFALAYLTSQVLPRNLAFWSSRWARPVIVTGQHSLEAYAFGVVLSFLAALAVNQGLESKLWILALDMAACTAMIAFSYGMRRAKSRGPDQEMPVAAKATPHPGAPKAGTTRRQTKRRTRGRRGRAARE